MDRPSPTDPPDEPFNRIKEFMEIEEKIKGFDSSHTLDQILQGSYLLLASPDWEKIIAQISSSPRQDFKATSGVLAELSRRYEEDPHNPLIVMAIGLRYLFQKEWESALAYFEWLEEIRRDRYPSVEPLIQALKNFLGRDNSSS